MNALEYTRALPDNTCRDANPSTHCLAIVGSWLSVVGSGQCSCPAGVGMFVLHSFFPTPIDYLSFVLMFVVKVLLLPSTQQRNRQNERVTV